jgi:CheY-like chemotaxis protein
MLRNADNSLHISSFLSAKMALEKLRLDGFAPDVLLLDINMPGITGWEFLDQLKALNLEANVYMYSSSIDPDDVKEARNYPMVRDFISKPLDARTIRQLLSVGREQRKVS